MGSETLGMTDSFLGSNPEFEKLHQEREFLCGRLGEASARRALRSRCPASGSSWAFPAAHVFRFARALWWLGVRINLQGWGLLLELLCRLRLHDEEREPFAATISNHAKRLFDGIDDECVFVHPHAARDFGYFIMSVFVEFDRNLNVIHMALLDHFSFRDR
jgi:hypothetical protein